MLLRSLGCLFVYSCVCLLGCLCVRLLGWLVGCLFDDCLLACPFVGVCMFFLIT